MAYDQIKCPYCFETFNHEMVAFRSETVFNRMEFDPTKQGRTRMDIEFDGDDPSVLAEYDRRARYGVKDGENADEKYEAYWRGKEKSEIFDEKIPPYQRPIILPGIDGGPFHYDEDGFAMSMTDIFGKETRRRVCPFCHNPLPMGYGKFPTKHICVIGITSAGKTVFLSKLIENIQSYAAAVGLSATVNSESSRAFVKKNAVKEKMPLPAGTQPEYISQPLFYQLRYGRYPDFKNSTFVIYDIAGENCTDEAKMLEFGKFILNSDGIILLIDPKELGFAGEVDKENLNKVLDTFNSLFSRNSLNPTPLALCISKSDMMRGALPELCYESVTTVNKRFNAQEYNRISMELSRFMDSQGDLQATKGKLNDHFKFYNLFAITSLNCSVEEQTVVIDGEERVVDVPANHPNPKRIEEPLYWLFKRFGYIESQGEIYVPFNETLVEDIRALEAQIQQSTAELNNLKAFDFKKKKELKEYLGALQNQLNYKRSLLIRQ